jgi:hypothetical protein
VLTGGFTLKTALIALLFATAVLTGCGDDDDDDDFARCDVEPETLSFGTVTTLPEDVITRTFVEPVTIANTGSQALLIYPQFTNPTGAAPPQFHMVEPTTEDFILAAGDTATVQMGVTLTQATAEGSYTGSLSLGTTCGVIPLSVIIVPE